MKPAGILFDYNGVIVTDEHLQKQAMENILAKYNIEISDTIYNEQCFGRSDKAGLENVQKLFPSLAKISTTDLVAEKVVEYQKLTKNMSLLAPGIREKLDELHQHFVIGLVTGSAHVELDHVLRQENLVQFFDVIISADDITRSKPDPEGYVKAVAALGLPKEKIAAIEDTPIGVAAAKAAGLKCLAVLQTVSANKLGSADIILRSITEITPEIVLKLLKA